MSTDDFIWTSTFNVTYQTEYKITTLGNAPSPVVDANPVLDGNGNPVTERAG
jgi:hypothetical protein